MVSLAHMFGKDVEIQKKKNSKMDVQLDNWLIELVSLFCGNLMLKSLQLKRIGRILRKIESKLSNLIHKLKSQTTHS